MPQPYTFIAIGTATSGEPITGNLVFRGEIIMAPDGVSKPIVIADETIRGLFDQLTGMISIGVVPPPGSTLRRQTARIDLDSDTVRIT